MAASVTKRPGRPRDTRADEAILQAAMAELAEAGFSGFTVDAVAARAGVGKATIYRRWPSKEALILDAASLIVSVPEAPDTGTLRGDLVGLLSRVYEEKITGAHENVMAGLMAEACVNPEMKALLGKYVARRRTSSAAVIQRAVERGELRPDVDPELLLDLLSGLLFYRALLADKAVNRRSIAEAVDLVLQGAVASPQQPARRR